jgi:hypothetical protein
MWPIQYASSRDRKIDLPRLVVENIAKHSQMLKSRNIILAEQFTLKPAYCLTTKGSPVYTSVDVLNKVWNMLYPLDCFIFLLICFTIQLGISLVVLFVFSTSVHSS